MKMTPSKPYFIRALYDWIVDNDCTPYIAVDATLPYVEVPTQFINEGKIILNILPSAVNHLLLGDEWISFSARFGGVPEEISIPIGAVIAIYAQENGQGMGFEPEPLPEDYFEDSLFQNQKGKQQTTHLNIVEGDNNESLTDERTHETASSSPQSKESSDKTDNNSKKKKKPTLTIIK